MKTLHTRAKQLQALLEDSLAGGVPVHQYEEVNHVFNVQTVMQW